MLERALRKVDWIRVVIRGEGGIVAAAVGFPAQSGE
jgi:hypothetical protein